VIIPVGVIIPVEMMRVIKGALWKFIGSNKEKRGFIMPQ
jgi:hypothetical protein